MTRSAWGRSSRNIGSCSRTYARSRSHTVRSGPPYRSCHAYTRCTQARSDRGGRPCCNTDHSDIRESRQSNSPEAHHRRPLLLLEHLRLLAPVRRPPRRSCRPGQANHPCPRRGARHRPRPPGHRRSSRIRQVLHSLPRAIPPEIRVQPERARGGRRARESKKARRRDRADIRTLSGNRSCQCTERPRPAALRDTRSA